MKPVSQITTKSCLSACIASLLELSAEEVPDFGETKEDQWWQECQDWLAERKMFLLMVRLGEEMPWFSLPHRALGIMIGFSKTGGILHACVGEVQGQEFSWIHDPAPAQTGIELIDAVAFMVPLDPNETPTIYRSTPKILRSSVIPSMPKLNGRKFRP